MLDKQIYLTKSPMEPMRPSPSFSNTFAAYGQKGTMQVSKLHHETNISNFSKPTASFGAYNMSGKSSDRITSFN